MTKKLTRAQLKDYRDQCSEELKGLWHDDAILALLDHIDELQREIEGAEKLLEEGMLCLPCSAELEHVLRGEEDEEHRDSD